MEVEREIRRAPLNKALGSDGISIGIQQQVLDIIIPSDEKYASFLLFSQYFWATNPSFDLLEAKRSIRYSSFPTIEQFSCANTFELSL